MRRLYSNVGSFDDARNTISRLRVRSEVEGVDSNRTRTARPEREIMDERTPPNIPTLRKQTPNPSPVIGTAWGSWVKVRRFIPIVDSCVTFSAFQGM